MTWLHTEVGNRQAAKENCPLSSHGKEAVQVAKGLQGAFVTPTGICSLAGAALTLQ